MNRLNVHLSIPASPEGNSNPWVHTLSIPVESLMPLSLRPFKLLRYICYAILAARGELSLSQEAVSPPFPYDSPTVDITDIPPEGVLDIYYHLNADEQPFPLDPQLECLTVSTSDSQVNLRRANFRETIVARDGTCVVTGHDVTVCAAAHLIAVSKGDDVRAIHFIRAACQLITFFC